jgi:hypothetical protein
MTSASSLKKVKTQPNCSQSSFSFPEIILFHAKSWPRPSVQSYRGLKTAMLLRCTLSFSQQSQLHLLIVLVEARTYVRAMILLAFSPQTTPTHLCSITTTIVTCHGRVKRHLGLFHTSKTGCRILCGPARRPAAW